jgi:hypothetical protein
MKPSILACCAALGAIVAAAAPLLAVPTPTPAASHNSTGSHSSSPKIRDAETEGDRVFQQNCARCHNTPDGFSPRITGTVVRHMRVRANLSERDEKVLLHYFNQ